MKNSIKVKLSLGCIMMLFNSLLNAQNDEVSHFDKPDYHEADKRMDNYRKLLKLGYTEKEIFEDLGNANFLTENYVSAIYWYKKLISLSDKGTIGDSYYERYQYALLQLSANKSVAVDTKRDWLSKIKEDYTVENKSLKIVPEKGYRSQFKEIDFRTGKALLDNLSFNEGQETIAVDYLKNEKEDYLNGYAKPMALTANGTVAYFSKVDYVKPMYGIFSKKEPVHRIYKAEKINGQWKNITEVDVCSKHYSAIHPSISKDGKRLFFASDMPGTFGKYDIYVSEIRKDGTMGIAKNLGKKVNTKKNDLYPNIIEDNSLFYASEGHKGFGGLDIYMAQVDTKRVGPSVNLGSPINSSQDDFAIHLMTDKGVGYVMSNRGDDTAAIQRLAFSYSNRNDDKRHDKEEYNFLEAFNNRLKIDYSMSVFED